MKVLLANKYFFRNGGSEVVFFEERDYLRAQGLAVAEFAMADARNEPSEFASFFVKPRSYRSGAGPLASLRDGLALIHSFAAVSQIDRLIRAVKPDLLHCHNIYHQLTPSIIGAAKRHGLKVVLTLHDYKPVCPIYVRRRAGAPCSDCLDGDFFPVVRHRCADGSLAKSALLYAEAVVQKRLGHYEKVDVVIAPSRFMADSVAGRRFPRDRVRVVPNGIDPDRVEPSYGDSGYALYLGRLAEEKGIKTLLEAHRKSPFPLKICGTGPLFESLSREYPEAGFLGYRSGAELAAVIAGAALVVVPSEWYENCPMAVLEAMAHGKPVVASRIGGIPELVSHGETGFLFEPGQPEDLLLQVSRLLGDRRLRESFARAARRKVETEFSLRRHHETLLSLYQQLLGQVED